MIGYLRGVVKSKDSVCVVLDVGGVGYEVQVASNTMDELPETDESVEIYTHYHVREDAHTIFGFTTAQDRDMFRVLITISQIGPRIALAILSELNVADLVASVELDDTRSLVKVPGIGSKTAARLLMELRDKIAHFPVADTSDGDERMTASIIVRETIDALVVMGFSHKESRRAALSVKGNAGSTEQAVRLALAAMGPVAS